MPAPRPDSADAVAPLLGEVSIPVPGTEGQVVALELDAQHTIWIRRPPAWTGSHLAPAERYRWAGGVVSIAKSGVPHAGPYDADDLAWKDPVLAVARHAAPGKKEGAELRKQCRAAWEDGWVRFAPLLHQRAATLSVTYEYLADLYRQLALRPDLCDHIEVCPALGPFLSADNAGQIPEAGWSLAQVAGHLIAPADGAHEPTPLAPGFMAWARGMRWDPSTLPAFPRNQTRQTMVRAFVRQAVAMGPAMDHNGIQKMTDPKQWLLLNLALASRLTTPLVPAILRNPESALKAIDKFFPPDMRLQQRAKIDQVLTAAGEWYRQNREKAEKITGFNRILEETRGWDRGMRRVEYEQSAQVDAFFAAREAAKEATRAQQRQAAVRVGGFARALGAMYVLSEGVDPALEFDNPPALREVADARWRMVYLDTPAELQFETITSSNCVVTHVANCTEGVRWGPKQGTKTWIFSLRSVAPKGDLGLTEEQQAIWQLTGRPHDRSLATIEVYAETGEWHEVRSWRNGNVSEEMKAWITRAIAQVCAAHREAKQQAGQPVAAEAPAPAARR